MNLELDSLKKEIQVLKDQLNKVAQGSVELKPVRFFKVYYELEYIEPLDLPLLFENMNSFEEISLSKIYICMTEHHDAKYDNPKYNLGRWNYKMHLWIVLHRPVCRDTFNRYFKKKVGAAVTESYLRYDEFLEEANKMKRMINGYYEVSLLGEVEKKKVPKVINV